MSSKKGGTHERPASSPSAPPSRGRDDVTRSLQRGARRLAGWEVYARPMGAGQAGRPAGRADVRAAGRMGVYFALGHSSRRH